MAKIAEIFGPPGIGKSSLIRCLDTINKKSDNWVVYSRVLSNHVESKKGLTELVRSLYKNLINIPQLIPFEDAFLRYFESREEAKSELWQIIDNNSHDEETGQDFRFEVARHCLNTINVLQTILENNTDKFVVYDEGMLSRIMHLFYKSTCNDELEKYIDTHGDYSVVVMLYLDCKTHYERVNKRHRKMIIHRHTDTLEKFNNYNKNVMQNMEYVCEYLEKQGVRILKVDASEHIKEQAKTISEYLNNG